MKKHYRQPPREKLVHWLCHLSKPWKPCSMARSWEWERWATRLCGSYHFEQNGLGGWRTAERGGGSCEEDQFISWNHPISASWNGWNATFFLFLGFTMFAFISWDIFLVLRNLTILKMLKSKVQQGGTPKTHQYQCLLSGSCLRDGPRVYGYRRWTPTWSTGKFLGLHFFLGTLSTPGVKTRTFSVAQHGSWLMAQVPSASSSTVSSM